MSQVSCLMLRLKSGRTLEFKLKHTLVANRLSGIIQVDSVNRRGTRFTIRICTLLSDDVTTSSQPVTAWRPLKGQLLLKRICQVVPL